MRNLAFRRSATVLSVVVLATSMSIPTSLAGPDRFSDDNESVHESDIDYIASQGIAKGCNPPGNDRYCPNRSVTRGEMAAYLARATGSSTSRPVGFKDASASVFRGDIAAIAGAGITKGCNPPKNDLFCPERPVTRAEMAAFLKRAFVLPSPSVDYFRDDNGSVFEDDINAVAHAGISVGCDAGTYCGSSPVTRAQIASFISRALRGGVNPPPPAGDSTGDQGSDGKAPSSLPAPGDPVPPAGAVLIEPGDSFAKAVANHPAGSTFYLKKGIHRLASARPKDNSTFVGAPGAILSGARVLDSFDRSGSFWVAAGQTQQNEQKGTCIDGYTGCVFPEQLFLDGRELWQVTSLNQLKAGSWYFDYVNDRIYLADDPSGRLVEASVVPVAFDGDGSGVTIRDLVIEKYATPAQMGAIHGQTDRNGPYGHDWLIEGNEIRLNASSGIALGHGMIVRANFIHSNGRLGVGSGLAEGALIQGNEISNNCRGTGYLCFGWGGGGVKLAGARHTVISGNYVHDNIGAGLHSDVQSEDTVFSNNQVVANHGAGIFVEVSNGASVVDNLVEDNGYERPEGRGAGIVVSASTDVSISRNELRNNALGIVAYHLDRAPGLDRLSVTENVVVQPDGHLGLRNQTSEPQYFDSITVVWDRNEYRLGSDDRIFVYERSLLSTSAWLSEGHDSSSTFK